MKSKFQLLSILTFFSFYAFGQAVDTTKQQQEIILERSLGLLTGVSFGKQTFVEIGLSKNSNTVVGHHPFSSTVFASTELKFGDKFILGPKIGAWAAGGVGAIAMGLNIIYYTNFDNSTLVFRPEIGLGFKTFKLVYGYNANLTKNRIDGINKNLASVVYCFKLKKLKDKTRGR